MSACPSSRDKTFILAPDFLEYEHGRELRYLVVCYVDSHLIHLLLAPHLNPMLHYNH